MSASVGLFRLKIVWACICALVGAALAFLFLDSGSGLERESAKLLAASCALTALTLGGTPLLAVSLKAKAAIIWLGVTTSAGIIDGKAEGAIFGVVSLAVVAISWWAIVWIKRGFRGDKETQRKG